MNPDPRNTTLMGTGPHSPRQQPFALKLALPRIMDADQTTMANGYWGDRKFCFAAAPDNHCVQVFALEESRQAALACRKYPSSICSASSRVTRRETITSAPGFSIEIERRRSSICTWLVRSLGPGIRITVGIAPGSDVGPENYTIQDAQRREDRSN